VTNDCNELDTSTRSTITLTLLLSAVAFKVSVASSLPQVPYFTFLDSFMWLLISFISLLAIENIAWPVASCTNRRWDLGQEHEVYVMYGFLFLLVALVGTMSLIAWRILRNNKSKFCQSKDGIMQLKDEEDTSSSSSSSSSSTTSPPPAVENEKRSRNTSSKVFASQPFD
jgi:cbb3-type cytochrome oxidase subunit 3